MSTYPGNTSLSAAVKERVLSTFQQTLTLLKQGRTDEVAQGCGLILRMDPMFDPAKKLLEKARNPAAPIDVDALLTIEPSADPMSEARTALARRDFQRAIDITTELLTQDLMNEDARVLNERARERMEAQPFIDQFAKKVQTAIAAGNTAAARADLDKIRSLDPEHPSLPGLQDAINRAGGAAAASPSFVVDNPAPASGRGTAQASDFGFTFEEEKPKEAAGGFGGFSFDSGSGLSPFSTDTGTTSPITPPAGFSFDAPFAAAPPAPEPAAPTGGFSFDAPASTPTPPPSPSPFGGGAFSFDAPAADKAPVSGEFDFATASIATSPDDQAKVQQYLADGDRAFEAGDDQQAIDLWSRIFLIDVTNEEASTRIERAKARKREGEQKVEGMLAAAVQAFDRNDKAGARDRFLEVLRMDPNNATASDYLERINSAMPAKPKTIEKPIPAFTPAPADDLFADEVASEGVYDEPAVEAPAVRPAAAPAAKKTTSKAAPAPAAKRGLPILPIIAAAVILLGGLGWFAWSKFSKSSYNAAATQATINQAQVLAQKGQYDLAIAMLQDIKPDDPQHDKALSMIADLQHRKTQSAELIGGRPAAVVFQENLANGKAAFAAHDYDAAKKAFDAAARIKALPPDMKTLYDTAAQQVAKLDSAKTLFKEGRYQDALGNLQQLEQQDPQNASIKRIITDAHFNLGAAALTEERLADAVKEFDEVLKNDPNDELAKRSKGLAERYNGQPKDLLYKIYVKYLPTRKVS